VQVSINSVDSFDWDGNSRPDKNLNGVIISPNTKVCRRLEINDNALNPAFNLSVGGVETRLTYIKLGSSSVKGWAAYFKGPRSPSKYTFDLRGETVALTKYECSGSDNSNDKCIEDNFTWQGFKCAGSNCAKFEIGPKKKPE
jgi:hypothetical protein